jgi:hypothetical protein
MKTMKLGGLSAAAAAAACTFGAVLPGMSENERRYGRFLRDAGGHGGAGDGRRDMAPEDVAKEIKADFDKKFDQLKASPKTRSARPAKGEPLAEGAKQKADEALVAVNEAKARLDELEQKMARGGSGEDDKVKSLGEQFVESDSFKAFAASGGPRNEKADLRLKTTLTSATTNAAGSLGDAVRPDPVARHHRSAAASDDRPRPDHAGPHGRQLPRVCEGDDPQQRCGAGRRGRHQAGNGHGVRSRLDLRRR